MSTPAHPTRRRFLQTASLAAAVSLAPRAFAAPFRNLVTGGRKVRVACIGLGGKGLSDSLACAGETSSRSATSISNAVANFSNVILRPPATATTARCSPKWATASTP